MSLTHVPSSPLARRAGFALIATFALSAAALAWMLREDPALGMSSPRVMVALVPAVVAYCVTGAYCLYLGIGAVRARQFPAPSAHLPVAARIRTGAAGLWAGAMMIAAAAGHGYLAWLAHASG